MIRFSWEAWHPVWVHWLRDVLHGGSGATQHPLVKGVMLLVRQPQVMNITSHTKNPLPPVTDHFAWGWTRALSEMTVDSEITGVLRNPTEDHGVCGWKLAESFGKGLPYRFYNCFFTNWWVLCNWHILSSQRLRHLIHFVGSLSVGPRLSVQLS